MSEVNLLMGKSRIHIKEITASPAVGHASPDGGDDMSYTKGTVLRVAQEYAEFWEGITLIAKRLTRKTFGVGGSFVERSLDNLAIVLNEEVSGSTVNVGISNVDKLYTVGIEHERTDGNYFHAVAYIARKSEASDINIPDEDFDTYDVAFEATVDDSHSGAEYGYIKIEASAWTPA